MPVEIREYGSAQEIADKLGKEISETEKALSDYVRRRDSMIASAERSKKIREVVLKLAGKKVSAESLGEISMGDVSIILEAKAFHELTALEPAIKSHQKHLLGLQKALEVLKSLNSLNDTKGLKYVTVENEGIPERIMFKVS